MHSLKTPISSPRLASPIELGLGLFRAPRMPAAKRPALEQAGKYLRGLFLMLFIQRGRDANREGSLSRDNFLF
jgi:hypothetical protein